MSSLVLVSEPEFVRAEALFKSTTAVRCLPGPPRDAELAAAIRQAGARHAIVGPFAYREAIYGSLPRGGVLARFGIGYDGIDLARATAAGLLCTNTPDVLHQSVAELIALFMLSAARRLLPLSGAMQRGLWAPAEGFELEGKTLAVIGVGRIGKAVARIAARGLQMRVIGCERSSSMPAAAPDFDAITSDFARAVRDADFVSLSIPGTPDNARFLNAERLSQVKPGAWLINTARGVVVDEIALFDALSAGRLAGAALDVFDREPYEPADAARDLRNLPNVILVPHVGTNTAEANRRMAERALANIAFAEAGNYAAMDLLNPEVLR